jgi:uncharacterized protein YmfQ (DUF2313 family)
MTTTNVNAPIPARNDALNKKSNELNQQPNLNPKPREFQYLCKFCCDECALPLRIYGENFVETYSNGRVNILRCLCDLHAEEFELEVAE